MTDGEHNELTEEHTGNETVPDSRNGGESETEIFDPPFSPVFEEDSPVDSSLDAAVGIEPATVLEEEPSSVLEIDPAPVFEEDASVDSSVEHIEVVGDLDETIEFEIPSLTAPPAEPTHDEDASTPEVVPEVVEEIHREDVSASREDESVDEDANEPAPLEDLPSPQVDEPTPQTNEPAPHEETSAPESSDGVFTEETEPRTPSDISSEATRDEDAPTPDMTRENLDTVEVHEEHGEDREDTIPLPVTSTDPLLHEDEPAAPHSETHTTPEEPAEKKPSAPLREDSPWAPHEEPAAAPSPDNEPADTASTQTEPFTSEESPAAVFSANDDDVSARMWAAVRDREPVLTGEEVSLVDDPTRTANIIGAPVKDSPVPRHAAPAPEIEHDAETVEEPSDPFAPPRAASSDVTDSSVTFDEAEGTTPPLDKETPSIPPLTRTPPRRTTIPSPSHSSAEETAPSEQHSRPEDVLRRRSVLRPRTPDLVEDIPPTDSVLPAATVAAAGLAASLPATSLPDTTSEESVTPSQQDLHEEAHSDEDSSDQTLVSEEVSARRRALVTPTESLPQQEDSSSAWRPRSGEDTPPAVPLPRRRSMTPSRLDDSLLEGTSVVAAVASRTGAHWASLLLLLFVPAAWYLAADAGARMALNPTGPAATGLLSSVALLELAGVVVIGLFIVLLTLRSSLGAWLTGLLVCLLGLPWILVPGLLREHAASVFDSVANSHVLGANLVHHVQLSGYSGRLFLGGLTVLALGIISHYVRRRGRKEEAVRAEVAQTNPDGAHFTARARRRAAKASAAQAKKERSS